MKTIQISDENWKKIVRLRVNLGCSTMDEVIERILKVLTKFKLSTELKDQEESKNE